MTGLFDHHLDISPDAPIDPAALPSHGGVYLISDSENQPILLASCENLRRVAVARLAPRDGDAPSKRTDLAPIARHIRWRGTFSRFETTWAHWQAARALFPKTYHKLIGIGPAWFLCVNVDDEAPRFETIKSRRRLDGRLIGPFATRRLADQWAEMLVDAFDLCRHHDILAKAPRGEACAYFEMGRCPAPCDGGSPMADYRAAVEAAVRFTLSDRAERLTQLHEQVGQASAALAFEKAASIQRTIDRVKATVNKGENRHVSDALGHAWLILQRGSPRRRSVRGNLIRPFFVHAGVITTGEPVALDVVSTAAPDWLASLSRSPETGPPPVDDAALRCEGLWLVAKFLFQGDKAPGLFVRADRAPSPDVLAGMITAQFGPK